jgi:hypothetical protein
MQAITTVITGTVSELQQSYYSRYQLMFTPESSLAPKFSIIKHLIYRYTLVALRRLPAHFLHDCNMTTSHLFATNPNSRWVMPHRKSGFPVCTGCTLWYSQVLWWLRQMTEIFAKPFETYIIISIDQSVTRTAWEIFMRFIQSIDVKCFKLRIP